jgi:hypothetical protein
MNTKPKDGGPAFPRAASPAFADYCQDGMTLRDYFAAKALQIAGKGKERTAEAIARRAYYIADAMLAERNKEQA